MIRPVSRLLRGARLALLAGLALTACDQRGSDNPGSNNLCVKYDTCGACIAGQTPLRDGDKGLAQTECALAAAGCWTTWEKPIKCDEQTIEPEASEGEDAGERADDESSAPAELDSRI